MSPRANPLWPCLLALSVALAPGRASRGTPDEVAAYLERHGLTELLAVHLEQQLDKASGEARSELAVRLAGLYAQLLEAQNEPAARAALEERSRKMLAVVPPEKADELRLALLRGSYRIAEKAAEDHRLRLNTPEEVKAAREALDHLAPQLASLRQDMRNTIEQLDRRLSRASAAETIEITESLDRLRVLQSQCTFLNAWALYYRGWLNGEEAHAREAEPLFGQLLNIESPTPQPSDVSVDLRAIEPVARAVLGMALCKSLTSSSATALGWVELLEHDNTFEGLRVQAPVWKIAVHLDHQEFVPARRILDDHLSEGGAIPLPWLRLVAVHGLERAVDDRNAAELARYAVSELATRQELDQILDLAKRYGVSALGDAGFALQYVSGVVKYQEARAAHGGEQPTIDPQLIALYEQTADLLEKALAEPDAKEYKSAPAACRRLFAWCLYYQGRFSDARAAFEAASAELPAEQAAEASWMAVVCLDKLAAAGKNPKLDAELAAAIDRFHAKYPSSEHVPELVLRRAASSNDASEQVVEQLLSIPPGSAEYAAAQQRLADALYKLYRDSTGERRMGYANQYLGVALPMLNGLREEMETVDPGGSHMEGSQRLIVLCRQIMEIALDEGIARVVAARQAIDALIELRDRRGVDLGPAMDELDSRRVQERLLADDAAAASTIADELWARDPSSIWSRLAVRNIFKHAQRRWKDQGAPAAERMAAQTLVAHHGGCVLREYEDQKNAIDQPGVMAIYAAVAEASMQLWQSTGQEERGKTALDLYEKLLAERPRNAEFLRATGLLAEKLGPTEHALESWRILAAALPVDTEPWYEAKFHFISLLAKSDPARARQIMDQHKQLYPDFGPPPWGPKLKGLDEAIPQPPPDAGPQEQNGGDEPDEPATRPDTARGYSESMRGDARL